MITRAAIRWHGVIYSLPPPNRHHDIIRMIHETICEPTGGRYSDHEDDDVQGFLDDEFPGRILTRKQAWVRADLARQLKGREPVPGALFSEDVW